MKYLNHLTLQVKQLDFASGVQPEMKPVVMLIQTVCGIIFLSSLGCSRKNVGQA